MLGVSQNAGDFSMRLPLMVIYSSTVTTCYWSLERRLALMGSQSFGRAKWWSLTWL